MPSTSMHFRREWLPSLLVLGGVAAAWTGAWLGGEALGSAQWLIWLGGLTSLAGLFWFLRRVSAAEVDLERLRDSVRQREQKLLEREADWDVTRRAIENQLAQQSKQLATREAALAGKLVTFHEWMEFPQPLDLSQHEEPSDAELAELSRKDRQLNELLQQETQRVFEDILRNKYMVDGQFQALLVRDDILALMRRVARLYKPDVDEPLLETSMAQVFRAGSRACLQFLVLLEQLPWNVKEQSFSSLYRYIRQGVKAYGVYKQTEPYWPYVNSAYMLGRFAMGAHPLTLAAWWFLGAWGQEGAKRLATQILHRQAMVMLQDVVRVIGYEVAGMYGGDFRHRDANWIYAVELTELVHRFPLSRESLSQALKQVGMLQLRHEYDRVYLYRCLAAHASPQPSRYRASVLLTGEEKGAIARRLEQFLATFIHGQTAERVAAWRNDVEERLGVKLNVAGRNETRSIEEQTSEALRSLASFLLAVKEREPAELRELLANARLFADLPAAEQEQTLEWLLENPPYYFEQPSLESTSPLVTRYLQDLAALAAHTSPHEAVIDDMLVDVALYLRQDARRMRQMLDKQYVALLADRLPTSAPERRFSPAVAKAVLDVIGPHEEPQFVYGNVGFEWPDGTAAPSYSRQNTWLVGVAGRLIVFSIDERPVLLWRGEGDIVARQVRRYVGGGVLLRGGTWLGDVRAESPQIHVAGPLILSHEPYFKPLLERCALAQAS